MNRAAKIVWQGVVIWGVLAGCACVQETGKKVWGTSIAHLEKARAQGQSTEVLITLKESFRRVEKILKDAGADVYLLRRDQGYLAAMHFKGHVDTTQVGVFFTRIQEGLTKIEVASMSPALMEQIADLVFSKIREAGWEKGL